MANETILISEVIPATPQRIFSAWLDSGQHSSFTGSQAAVSPFVGGAYSAWDGYVRGKTLELDDGTRIVQSWRTTEFPGDSPDSRLEITLEPTLGGTLLTLLHTDIPSGQSDQYREGWNEYYLSRMKTYFAEAADAFGQDSEDAKDFSDARGAIDVAAFESEHFPTAGSGTPEAHVPAPRRAVRATAKKPGKAAVKATTKPTAKNPVKATTKAKAKNPVKAKAKNPVKATTKATTKSPVKATTKATTKSPVKATAKATTKNPVKAKAKATTKAKTKQRALPARKSKAKAPKQPKTRGRAAKTTRSASRKRRH